MIKLKWLGALALVLSGLAHADNSSIPTRTFTAAAPGYVNMSTMPFPATLGVNVASGDTDTCYTTLTPNALYPSVTATWVAIGTLTSVTASAQVSLPTRVQAIKCIQTVGTGADSVDVSSGY